MRGCKCAGGSIIMVSSGLGQRQNISAAYAKQVADAPDLETLAQVSMQTICLSRVTAASLVHGVSTANASDQICMNSAFAPGCALQR